MGCARSRDAPYAIKKRVNKIVAKERVGDNCTRIKFMVIPSDININGSTTMMTQFDAIKSKNLSIPNFNVSDIKLQWFVI
jgi:hypothetical protein